MKFSNKVNTAIDWGGLLLGLGVDLIAGIICFIKMAPDFVTQIAFVALSVMMVLFIARAWVKKQRVFWFCCMIVVFFFDLSFILVSTDTQSTNSTIETDQELSRLTTESTDAKNDLLDLRKQFREAVRESTIADLQKQIDRAEVKKDQIDKDRLERFNLVSSGKVTTKSITAKSIFSSIPDAITHGRILEFIVWAFVAGAIQGMIVSSLSEVETVRIKRKYNRRKKIDPALKKRYAEMARQQDGNTLSPSVMAKLLGIQEQEAKDIHETLVD